MQPEANNSGSSSETLHYFHYFSRRHFTRQSRDVQRRLAPVPDESVEKSLGIHPARGQFRQTEPTVCTEKRARQGSHAHLPADHHNRLYFVPVDRLWLLHCGDARGAEVSRRSEN